MCEYTGVSENGSTDFPYRPSTVRRLPTVVTRNDSL